MSETSQIIDRLIIPIERILLKLSTLPRWWIRILIIAALISVISVGISEGGNFFIKISISTITAVLVALIWLPSLLQTIALVGVGIKGEDAEINAPGLLTLFPKMLAALDAAEPQLPEYTRGIVREIRERAEVEWALLVPSPEQAREQLTDCAQSYETIRRIMTNGRQRTAEMLAIAAKVRVLAGRVNLNPSELHDLFMSGSEGNRMVALEYLIAMPSPTCFDIVLQAIGNSKSAFEQSAALRAAERILLSLNDEQKQQLASAIEDQRSGGEGKFIVRGLDDRWDVSSRILEKI